MRPATEINDVAHAAADAVNSLSNAPPDLVVVLLAIGALILVGFMIFVIWQLLKNRNGDWVTKDDLRHLEDRVEKGLHAHDEKNDADFKRVESKIDHVADDVREIKEALKK